MKMSAGINKFSKRTSDFTLESEIKISTPKMEIGEVLVGCRCSSDSLSLNCLQPP